MSVKTHATPWVFAPFVWVWQLVTFILGLTGRLLALVLGFVLLLVGFLVSLTVIGAIAGIPRVIVGFALCVCGLFWGWGVGGGGRDSGPGGARPTWKGTRPGGSPAAA